MNITDPRAIPAAKRDTIKAVLAKIGPVVCGDQYPTDDDGQPLTSLTNPQAADVFEAVTRKFWRDQITAHEAEQAAETARQAAIADNDTDPFDGE